MRKREQLLWDAMRRNLPRELWLQRVENVAGDGMPDVYVGFSGKWVELKAPSKIPKRETTPLLGAEGLRPSQVNWLLQHRNSCAPIAFILIRTIENELLLIHGMHAKIINELPLRKLRDMCFAQSWHDIAAYIG